MFKQILPMIIILALSVMGHNKTVIIAAGILLAAKLLHMDFTFPYFEKYSLTIGIVFLTIAILTPVITGEVTLEIMKNVSFSLPGLVTIIIAAVTAWVAGYGIVIIKTSPEIIATLLIGTLVGIQFFDGVPIGPLIAAGFTALVFKIIGFQ